MQINTLNNRNIMEYQNKIGIKKVHFKGGRVMLLGSFDPPTVGHMYLIETGSQIGDELIVAVGQNPKKKPFITVEERIKLLKECIYVSDLKNKNIIVDAYQNLSESVIKNTQIMLRGLRDSIENFKDEVRFAKDFELINPNLKTMFLFGLGKKDIKEMSSTLVRKKFFENGDFSSLVPKTVANYLNELRLKNLL